jgi:hypothetical protein
MGSDSSDFQKLITGTFNGVSQNLDISSPQQGVQIIQISGTWVGSLIAEGSNDGITYYPLIILSDTTFLLLSSITVSGSYTSLSNGYNTVRLRSSAWTSGTATVNVWGSEGMALNMSIGLIRGGTDGTIIGNTGDALKVTGNFSSGAIDKSTFTYGTTQETPIGGVYQDTAPGLTAGTTGAFRSTANRALHINLRDSAGTESGTASNPIRIDPTGATTQPVSGTVTVNQGTSPWVTSATQSGSWSVSVSNFPADSDALAQGSTTSGQLGSLIQGAVTTAAPAYTTGQTSPLSLTTTGLLRVDGSGVTQPISAASLPLPTGAATETTLAAQSTLMGSLTETAPATDTASSGFNGRLQRIAQRITSLIALFPTSIGQKTMAGSLAVTLASDQGAITAQDIINVSGQYRAQSVTTSAAEALGAASILTNRKMLSITPTNGTIYWGFSNAVTISSGSPIFKNQTITFAVGPNVHIYIIAGATTDVRITEGS